MCQEAGVDLWLLPSLPPAFAPTSLQPAQECWVFPEASVLFSAHPPWIGAGCDLPGLSCLALVTPGSWGQGMSAAGQGSPAPLAQR